MAGAAGGFDTRADNIRDFVDAVFCLFALGQRVAGFDTECFLDLLNGNFAGTVDLNRPNAWRQVSWSSGKQRRNEEKGTNVSHGSSMRRERSDSGSAFVLGLPVGQVTDEGKLDFLVIERLVHHEQEQNQDGKPQQGPNGNKEPGKDMDERQQNGERNAENDAE